MINIKDLQIGDWVMTPYGWHKVDTIYGSIERLLADMIEFDISELDAIPITPEILEKNGFEIVHGLGYSESYPTYGWGYHKGLRDYASVGVTFYDEPIGGVSRLVRMETASKKDDGINSIHSCDIEFIHQLQHCLKLVGIDKEIVL